MPPNAADPRKAPLRGGTAQLQETARAKARQGEGGLVPAAGWDYPGSRGSILRRRPVSALMEAQTTF